MDEDAVEMISKLRTFVEERFRALSNAHSDEARKNAARARLREIEKVIHQLENLKFPIPGEIASEKKALEKFLRVPIKDPSRQRNELVSLAKNLGALEQQMHHRLRHMRARKTARAGRAAPGELRVEFSDGRVVLEENSTRTFVEAIRFIGLKRVSRLPILSRGHRLVSATRPPSTP